jgi:hypothetical protein
MKIMATLAVLALLAGAGAARAQSAPPVDQRVRITLRSGERLAGTVAVGEQADSVWALTDATGYTRTVPAGSVVSVEHSRGRERRFIKYLMIGTLGSATAGGLLAAVTYTPCTETGFLACFLHPASATEAFGWGFVGGGMIGVPVGVLTGLVVREEGWERVSPGSTGADLRLVGRGGGLALRATVPVGRR